MHRTGHGIGLEEHEDPYIVAGNSTPVTAGHVFSVEPGIYMQGRYGVRIEDIVAATPAGLALSTWPTTPSLSSRHDVVPPSWPGVAPSPPPGRRGGQPCACH